MAALSARWSSYRGEINSFGGASPSAQGSGLKPIIATSRAVGSPLRVWWGGRDGRSRVLARGDELNMEGVYGPEGAGMGLPVKVSERQSGDKARGKQFVYSMRVGVLDYLERQDQSSSERQGARESLLPVTLDVEKGCSIANSLRPQWASWGDRLRQSIRRQDGDRASRYCKTARCRCSEGATLGPLPAAQAGQLGMVGQRQNQVAPEHNPMSRWCGAGAAMASFKRDFSVWLLGPSTSYTQQLWRVCKQSGIRGASSRFSTSSDCHTSTTTMSSRRARRHSTASSP